MKMFDYCMMVCFFFMGILTMLLYIKNKWELEAPFKQIILLCFIMFVVCGALFFIKFMSY